MISPLLERAFFMSEQKMYLYGFTQLPYITPKRFKRIQDQFQNNLQAAWEYIDEWNIQLTPEQKRKTKEQYTSLHLESSYDFLQKEEISLISWNDKIYPHQFKNCPSPPYALFYKGTLPLPQQRILTVVGSRKITAYGQNILEKILPPTLAHEVGVASGLAYGVDKYAHDLALKHNAYTLAVLPGGLDKISPRNHYQLAKSIIENNGCLISEIPPGQKITKGAFPRRNRLLAALGEATLVIEAARKSGSKITAYQAINAGKDVAAVPGPIFSEQSQGCHDLIKDGATPICSSQDLLDLLNLNTQVKQLSLNLSHEEAAIQSLLTHMPREEVIEQSPYNLQKTLQILTSLELKH